MLDNKKTSRDIDKIEVYSKPVRAGKRTYFFDVKATKGDNYYLTVTESKKVVEADGNFFFEKHKIFLYQEDFAKFVDGLNDALEFIYSNTREIPAKPSLEGIVELEFDDLEKN